MNISAVAEKYNLTASTIRYYERIGLIPEVSRNSGGIRTFDQNDLKWIDFISCMKAAGLPLDVLKRYTELVREGDKTLEERKNILIRERTELKKRVVEVEEVINKLDHKINDYEGLLLEKEQKMI
jgi:DNA-binding transcriptional MerR regulator